MSILLDRILILCKIHNTKLYRIENTLDLSSNSMRKWGNSMPSGDKIQKVADYFDVSTDYLLGRTDNPKSHKSTLDRIVPAVTQINFAVDRLKAELDEILTDFHLNPIPYNPTAGENLKTELPTDTAESK